MKIVAKVRIFTDGKEGPTNIKIERSVHKTTTKVKRFFSFKTGERSAENWVCKSVKENGDDDVVETVDVNDDDEKEEDEALSLLGKVEDGCEELRL
jgi:hypothetical protein